MISIPKVSIGLPVFNGERLLSRALDAILAQTFKDFELIISDNASTDCTAAICREYVKRDSRIRYIRQPSNRGPAKNFKFVLDEARGEYFNWAAHDDWRAPEYIAANLAVLEADPELVCSVSRVEFVDETGLLMPYDAGTRPLKRSARENILSYLKNPATNSRFYGLFRTLVLRESFFEADTYWGLDWVIMARTLMAGKHHELERCLLRRGASGMSSRGLKTLHLFNRSPIGRLLPLWPMSWALWLDPAMPRSCALGWILLRANAVNFISGHVLQKLRRLRRAN